MSSFSVELFCCSTVCIYTIVLLCVFGNGNKTNLRMGIDCMEMGGRKYECKIHCRSSVV